VAPSGVVADNFEFGDETNLSASEFSVGGGDAVNGADAATGIAMDGGAFGGLTAGDVKPVAPAVAAATAVTGGAAPGVTPAMAMADGEDWAEGRAGVLEVAATAEFSAALSCFHHAKRDAV
jgi:hypothetical protein